MLVSKLWNNEKEAVAEALACVMTIKAQSGEVSDNTINTLRAMLGLKPKIEDELKIEDTLQIDNDILEKQTIGGN